MKKLCTLFALAVLLLPGLVAQAQTTTATQSVLIDFGVNDGTNGNSTPSPDANGSYWNNVLNNTGDTFSLIDKTNAATNIKLNVGPNFLTNGILNGGLLTPDAALLGQYAVATATQDYFFVQGTGATSTATIRLSGLDPAKRYVFHVFGSRQIATERRVSRYTFAGATTNTITQTTSGADVGANGYPGNNNTVTDSDTLAANSSGIIELTLSKSAGSFAYLNLIRVDIVPARATPPPPPATANTFFYFDFGVDDGTNGNPTASPDANGNYWNNVLNITSAADTFRLVDNANRTTGVKLAVGPNFLTNGINTGGLLAPDAALLGQYAVATATQDYFFVQGTGSTATGRLRLSGLDRTKRYVFHVFGSRQIATETRVSRYTFAGATTSTFTQTTSGANVGANGYPGNNNTISDSDTLSADANGMIELTLSKEAGSFAYLNLMRVDVVPNRNPVTGNIAFQNPGFELGNFTNWTTTARGTGATTTISTATKHAGSYAAQLAGGSLALEQQITYVPTIGTTAQKLSGWFYNPATAGLQGSQAVHLELLYYNSNNVLLGQFRSDSLTAASPAGTWTQLQTTATIPTGTAYVKGAAVWRNSAGAAGSAYFDDLLLEPYTVPIPQNPLKIVYMGSSVPYGTGATNNYGYTAMYSDLLARRATAGTGQPWVTANISVPGNNTVDVRNRYAADLLPQHGKYVVYALALGNEGILTGGQPIFDQFRTNMTQLIKQARADGMVPIVTNSYTRSDYTAEAYAFVRQMNLLIHGWNVPSVNLLGAVDDGQGRWAAGYRFDDLHPNDLGHAEMAHTLVPSLFDALHAGKPLPTRRPGAGAGITLGKTVGQPTSVVRFVPEDVVHPFTQALRFKTNGAGQLVEIRDSAGIAAGTIRISTDGKLLYTSAKGQTITGTVPVANNRWHKLVLTHFYARGTTMLYVDSVREGSVAERLRPTQFEVGGTTAPTKLQLRDWLLYRSGMNQDEVLAMAADSLLKSSLELYAPLDGRPTADSLVNLAQSLNTLARTAGPVTLGTRESTRAAQVILYPNPTTGELRLLAPWNLEGTEVRLYDTMGRLVLRTKAVGGKLNIGALKSGVYSLVFETTDGLVHKRIVRQAN
ncbi:T9SS type A sorting domain-containing protein [Hymenobacter sp. BT507]|uniref:T9SS type A sorting domain-containing protein n=1 Tax=Hymenobacter citatus TaxID=2763506 RepID=A0ABR7MKK7_9BACT|nr:SGNH/GDSL hydrolase family protein [Hymenobacter citatus]MBC6611619.1 T9SS type A sorting domain-containing protein [Hymenobacter citatus]